MRAEFDFCLFVSAKESLVGFARGFTTDFIYYPFGWLSAHIYNYWLQLDLPFEAKQIIFVCVCSI